MASAPDLSIPDPTPGGTTAHGESEYHHSRHDECDRDPDDGSTKNSLHDGPHCLESGRSSRITVSLLVRAPSVIGSRLSRAPAQGALAPAGAPDRRTRTVSLMSALSWA